MICTNLLGVQSNFFQKEKKMQTQPTIFVFKNYCLQKRKLNQTPRRIFKVSTNLISRDMNFSKFYLKPGIYILCNVTTVDTGQKF